MQIANHTFFVTGGSSGLGAACVRHVVAFGGRAVIADVNRSAGEALVSELGGNAVFAATDVTDEDSVKSALDAGVQRFQHIHGVIQCAGIVHGEKILGKAGPHAFASFAKVIQVNLIGTFNVLRMSAAVMEKNEPDADGERGIVICTASVAAFDGQIGQAAYAASKGGVASLVLPAARELAGKGIRVVAIAPGIFDTPMLAALPEPVRQSLGQQVPFPPRLGKPEEYARLAQHLCENVMLNGCVIRLDGALRMTAK